MPSSSFPLLRLPLVALREIFEKIALRELFLLSLCSKRIHYAVKHFRDKSVKATLKVHGTRNICLNNQIKFTVYAMNDDPLEGRKMERIEGRAVCILQEFRNSFLTFWENEVAGTKALVKYISALFEVKVELLSVSRASFLMMDYVEELQGPGSYRAEIGDVTEEQLEHVLVDLNPKSLLINQAASNWVEINNFNKKFDKFEMFNGGWITVENICALDCIELQLVHKIFLSTEINQYFKHVMAGGSPRLKVFECRVRSANSNTILAGIREFLKAVPGKEQFTSDHHGNWEFNGRLNRGEGSVLVHINYFSRFKRIRLSVRKM